MYRYLAIPVGIFMCSSAHKAAFFKKRQSIRGLYSARYADSSKEALAMDSSRICLDGKGPKQIQVVDLQNVLIDRCQRTSQHSDLTFYRCGQSKLEFSQNKNISLFDEIKVVRQVSTGIYDLQAAHVVALNHVLLNQSAKGVGIKDRQAIGIAKKDRLLLIQDLKELHKSQRLHKIPDINQKKKSQLGISIKSASQESGALVIRVSSESPLAGKIFLGNIIKQVNGKVVQSAEEASLLLKQGGKMRMKIRQQSGYRQVEVQL